MGKLWLEQLSYGDNRGYLSLHWPSSSPLQRQRVLVSPIFYRDNEGKMKVGLAVQVRSTRLPAQPDGNAFACLFVVWYCDRSKAL